MPYYHVRIRRIKQRPSVVYLFDLSKGHLKDFLTSARKGKEIYLPDFTSLEPGYIEDMEIVETNKKSEHYGIGYMKGQNIFEKGKNVTLQFVKKPFERNKTVSPSVKISSKNVFIVHGRDTKSLKELRRMIAEFGLNPIVLHEQPSGSMTIVEKLEYYSGDIGFAFVLLTSDDALVPTIQTVKVNKKHGTITPVYFFNPPPISRARQNVILEFGFFVAKLGRKKVCCLYKGDTELPYDMPSDMHGMVYIPFKESVNEVRDKIIKELKAVGYEIKI